MDTSKRKPMKNIIKLITTSVLVIVKLLLLSLLCYIVYEQSHLVKIFGSNISYSQWIAIVVIVNALVPVVPTVTTKSKSIDDK